MTNGNVQKLGNFDGEIGRWPSRLELRWLDVSAYERTSMKPEHGHVFEKGKIAFLQMKLPFVWIDHVGAYLSVDDLYKVLGFFH